MGTEMVLRLDSEMDPELWTETPLPEHPDSEFASSMGDRPFVVRKPGGAPVADVINVAFSGSEDLVRRSFLSAGWKNAEPLNRRSFGKAYKAFTERSGYEEAPVSQLLYQGRPPDLVFQKSLNSIAKRHHIRLWRIDVGGVEGWVGAASHDIGVIFDRKTFMLSHRIDSDLDAERQKILGDLAFADAVAGLSYIPRIVGFNALGRTDGKLAVAQLQEPVHHAEVVREQPRISFSRKMVRRVILEARQYVLRENVYYIGYLSIRKLLDRRSSSEDER
jgi:hypothetical protein